MRPQILPLLCLCLSLIACGEDDPVVVGLWSGQTSGCTLAQDDGASLTLSITNGPDSPDGDELAVVTTALGKPGGAALSCQGSGATIDGYADRASFSYTATCDGVAYAYEVEVALDGADTLTGSLTYGDGARCDVKLSRGD
jgi:hypothetical protein